MTTTRWSYPTQIIFGEGALHQLGAECLRLGLSRVLVVTDPGVIKAGIAAQVTQALEAAAITSTTFSDLSTNPTQAEVEAAAAAFASCQAQGVIGVGGGAAMDSAKLVSVRAATTLSFAELDDAKGGSDLVPLRLASVITVPTTAGTGSEVGRAAVVTVAETGRKTVVFSPSMMPKVALLDPTLTVGLPAAVTAATGFDALTHLLEAYVSKGDHPLADGIALAGLELCAEHLERAVRTPGDLTARGGMMKAAMMGAVAFQKGLGACHSLAHPLSSVAGLHHGLANALCLPAVCRFNLSAVPARFERVARALGADGATSTADWLATLRKNVGLPGSLREAGVAESQLEHVAEEAVLDGCHQGNPRACTQADFLKLLQECY